MRDSGFYTPEGVASRMLRPDFSGTRILNSFSMGRSSALLSKMLPGLYPGAEIVTVTANTGQERPESLAFGKAVDEHLGLNATLVEAVVHPELRKGTTHRVVTWDSAYCGDAIFESMIAKYGIPNMNFPHCTRELKDRPITSYLRSIGWKTGTYKIALGIRADEPDRVPAALGGKKKRHDPRFLYPLWEAGITSEDVDAFWDEMPFSLKLKPRHGNCQTCWKKSEKKLLLNMQEHPEWFNFNERMEARYGFTGAGTTDEPRVFFRGKKSTEMLRRRLKVLGPIHDKADSSEPETGCAEACYPFAS